MNRIYLLEFLKKYKKLLIIFLMITLCFVFVPIIYEIALPKFGKITYKINNYGLSFESAINNKKKKDFFGKIGKITKPISLIEEYGYCLDSWNDGVTSLTREDSFEYGAKTYAATSRYANFDMENINFKLSYSSIADVGINVNGTVSTEGEIHEMFIDSISFINDFENNNGQPKKNLLLKRTIDGVQEIWIGRSMHYDKTLLRQKIAIDTYNEIYNNGISFCLSNTYFDNEYYGCYLFQKINVIENACLVTCANSETNNFDFLINGRKFIILDNCSSMSKDSVANIISDYHNSNNKLQFIDANNIIRKATLSNVFNNSAEFENDVMFFVNSDSKIIFLDVDSFSLSMGLFRYGNYSPNGTTKFNFLIEPLLTQTLIADSIKKEMIKFKSVLDNLLLNFDVYADCYAHSFLENNKKFMISSTFGTPNELMNCKTYNEHLNYLKEWLTKRNAWVSESY